MKQFKKVPCVIMRGGTSKGIFFHENQLPSDKTERDKLLLKVMGSPDPKQIDGLGGATSSTSKVAIIKKSNRPNTDIDYTFAQVVIDKPIVDYQGNCGNLSSAVGPFAIDEGLVEPIEPITRVRIYNINTKKIIEAEVPVSNGKAAVYGNCEISGVLGTGPLIRLTFKDPGGSVTGKLLPTGNVIDNLYIPGFGKIKATIIDASNPAVFVRAEDINLKGTELPDDINRQPEKLELLEKIRGVAAQKINMVDKWENAAKKVPSIPRVAFFTNSKTFEDLTGKKVNSNNMDICARIVSLQKLHRAYVLTGAIATGVAAKIRGSLLYDCIKGIKQKDKIVIGHPSGLLSVEVKIKEKNSSIQVQEVTVIRTARRLMDGYIYVK